MPIWTKAYISLREDHLPWAGHWPAQGAMTAAALAEAQQLLTPQAVYEIVPLLERTPQGPRLEGGTLLHSLDLLASLGPATHIALTVCTIGPHLEARTRAYGEQGQTMRSFILDALGTAALGELSRQLQQHLAAQLAPQGLGLGSELAPGQLDWPIEDQTALLSLLHPEQIGVRLNEQYLMLPLKSVSAAIPIGREGELPAVGPACARCPKQKTCPYAKSASQR